MKTSVLLGGSFLLSLLFWNSSELEPAVTSMCSDDWLIARMKRKPFDNDTEVRIGDIHLGNNCSVTRMLSFNYEFSYSVLHCGINKFVFQGYDVFILSEINYRPTLDVTYKFQVVCFVKRLRFASLMPFGMNGYEANSLGERAQETKEGRQLWAPPQSKICEPRLSGYNEDQVFIHPGTNKACVVTSSHP